MSNLEPDKKPKPQSAPSGGPPKPPKKTTRGLEDGLPNDPQNGPANFGAEYIDLSRVQFTPVLLGLIPAEKARKYHVLPVFKMPGRVGIVTADPSDLNAIDDLVHFLNRSVDLCVTDKSQLKAFIERLYPNPAT